MACISVENCKRLSSALGHTNISNQMFFEFCKDMDFLRSCLCKIIEDDVDNVSLIP